MAKKIRLWPSMRISITVVRPASAPKEITWAMVFSPTDLKASARGASTLISLYLTIPVTTSETST